MWIKIRTRYAGYVNKTYATNYRSLLLHCYNFELGLEHQTLLTLVVRTVHKPFFRAVGKRLENRVANFL